MLQLKWILLICLAAWLQQFRNHGCRADVRCRDARTVCQDQATCCLMQSGDYGCCPMPAAVCCSDNVHCCPRDTLCDLQHLQCVKSGSTARPAAMSRLRGGMMEKRPFNYSTPPTAACQPSSCPDDSTCCEMTSGRTGCCPVVGAVCCPDQTHCCPSGSVCQLLGGCVRERIPLVGRWSEKFQAQRATNRSNKGVVCDAKYQCPSGTTCCKLASGKWGCCQMPHAVCCSDGVHCCPQNTVCDLDQGRCVQSGQSTVAPATTQLTYLSKAEKYSKVRIACGPRGSFDCPDRSTCCKMRTGDWGCCPESEAVCCSDGVHCCPHNTLCDASRGRCVQNDARRFFDGEIPTREIAVAGTPQTLVKLCPDQKLECATNQTCCLYANRWSCCPLPLAVCCPDSPHCCPKGEKCGTSGQTCMAEETTGDF